MEVDRVALAVSTVSTSKMEQNRKDRVNKGSSDGKSWWMTGVERAARSKEGLNRGSNALETNHVTAELTLLQSL